jgi:hypothetical protein
VSRWNAVVLRHKDFSLLKVGVAGALGGSARYPAPKLGERCVCCDQTDVGFRHFDPSTDRFQAEPIAIPLCETCAEHVSLSTHAQQFVAALICMGIGGVLYAVMNELWKWAAVAALLLAGLAAWGLARLSKRDRFARNGHHTGLEISAHPGQCAIRTTNPRLAAEIAILNKDFLFRK